MEPERDNNSNWLAKLGNVVDAVAELINKISKSGILIAERLEALILRLFVFGSLLYVLWTIARKH